MAPLASEKTSSGTEMPPNEPEPKRAFFTEKVRSPFESSIFNVPESDPYPPMPRSEKKGMPETSAPATVRST